MSEPNIGERHDTTGLELRICQGVLALVIALSALQVVLRYVFNSPLDWVGEICSLGVVWLTFLGATGLLRQQAHARVELVEEIWGRGGVVRWLETLFDLIGLAYTLAITYGGIVLIAALSYQRSPVLRLPPAIELGIVPITAAVMAIYLVLRLARRLLRSGRGDIQNA